MATLIKRKIELRIVWDKNDPANLSWVAVCNAVTPDDKNEAGEEKFRVATDPQTITRATFAGLTGAQIQSQVVAAVDAKLQALGTGAGTHTLQDDFG